MERVRLTANEVMTLKTAFDKLLKMDSRSRRKCEGWQIVKNACLKTGNWKRAVSNPSPSFGGKPNRGFARQSASVPARETAYVPTGTYD
jgi:hypothetical protein